ncbi:MAG: hydantoinase B/oxoprolinase family protein [Pseudomonadota bacterium]
MSIDAFSLQIAWNGLRSICDEAFLSLMRSSFSTNIKERHDHSTAVLDADGRLVAQAELSLPIHLASMTGMIEALVERYAGRMQPGDIYCANDPHVAGGTHLPDINLAAPVFHEGELVGFVANIAHHADVGGAAAGSMSGGLTEVWQEGVRIPLVKLVSAGEMQRDVLDLMLLNMRLPQERLGDLNAQIAACRLAEGRLGQMASELGPDKLNVVYGEILSRSEQRMRSAISAFPDGVYTFEDVLDDDGAGMQDLPIRLRVSKSGDSISFDFTGSSPQAMGNVNLTYNAVQSAVFYSLKALLDPELPNNQGVFAPVEIIAEEGSLLNCRPPGAVALRANTCQRVVDVVLGALGPGLPERAIGAANGANTSAVFAGNDPETGEGYVYLETLGGGMGARFTKNGKDGVQVHITNTSNLPVEAIEMEYPLRVLEYSLRNGSGGNGRHRGGMGLRRVVTPVGHDAVFSGVGERFRHTPWGFDGGEPGATGEFHMIAPDGTENRLPNKSLSLPLKEGHAVIIETPGAGGYGKPDD